MKPRVSLTFMRPNSSAPTYPTGWFAVAFSHELKTGAVLRRSLMGRELVAFRTKSGRAVVLDAHCPHLGAHLGEGGRVVGENIHCPFHDFAFGPEGKCESTPYAGRTPNLSVGSYPIDEASGAVMCFFGPRGSRSCTPPEWHLAPTPVSLGTWSSVQGRTFTVKTHVREIYENTVDLGHFSPVHGYANVSVLAPFQFDGTYMRAALSVTRSQGLFGRASKPISMKLDICASGLGHSRVEVETSLGLSFRTIVMATPVDLENVELRFATQAKAPRGSRMFAEILARMALREGIADVEHDMRIWANKIYLSKPGLTKGDGPILAYRRWATQFLNADASSLNAEVSDERFVAAS